MLVRLIVLAAVGFPAAALAQSECPATAETDNVAAARMWHEEVINRRNPAALADILGESVVHHAAGGYPDTMDAAGVTAMMGDFLTAFPDLVYSFDLFVAEGRPRRRALYGDRNPDRPARHAGGLRQGGDLDRDQHFPLRMRQDRRGVVGGRCAEPKPAACRGVGWQVMPA